MKWEYLVLESEIVAPLRDLSRPYRNSKRGIELSPGEPFPYFPYFETVWKKNGVEEDSLNSMLCWEVLNLFGSDGWELVSAAAPFPASAAAPFIFKRSS